MATNYTFAEAVRLLATSNDTVILADIGKRYPLTCRFINRIGGTSAAADFVALSAAFPPFLTMQKVEKSFKADNTASDASEDVDDTEDTTEEEKPVKDVAEPKKGTGRRGRPKKVKEPEPVEEDDSEAVEEPVSDSKESEDNSTPYDDMTAPELFKACKKRGIKAAPKKPCKFYIDLLVEDDNAKTEPVDDGDDWDDDEEGEAPSPAPTPVKKRGRPAKAKAEKSEEKPAKKSAPVEEDDDDSWDI